MSFSLYTSNSLEGLAQKLTENLQETRDVFQPQFIVTQTEGMTNWLKFQLAERMGIAANCRFRQPNDVILHIYELLGGERSSLLSTQQVKWLLYELLGEEAFGQKFGAIKAYFGEDAVKRLGLAEKTADLFDQYQIYRPEMIEEWNHERGEPEEWQAFLWKRAKEKAGISLPDKTLIGKYIREGLLTKEGQQAIQKISSIHFFGLSILTAYHLQLLSEAANYIDIHFHLHDALCNFKRTEE
ncbi:MAG: hypothetical protein EOO01_10670 [Chitinophagaceae bacterium]|nr:MAG: hypothetical protein EOO01_10670 [Chitinophagaceae bacterium]